MNGNGHAFLTDYDDPSLDRDWGFVLVDHKPGDRRGRDVLRFADKAQIIVAHDSEHGGYGYEGVFEQFKYRRDLTALTPTTAVVSNSQAV